LSEGPDAYSHHLLDARGPTKPAYERPLEPPEMSAASSANRPSIVSFGATQVSATLRNTDSGALASRPKSSAAEIGDFGAGEGVAGHSEAAMVGNAIPMAELGSALAVPSFSRGLGDRDSCSIYSDEVASGPPSPAFPQDLEHGQSVYSLGQYYNDDDQDGQYDDNLSDSAYRMPRSRVADGLSITTGVAFDETAPAPLTPPMEEAPSARRRNPTTNGVSRATPSSSRPTQLTSLSFPLQAKARPTPLATRSATTFDLLLFALPRIRRFYLTKGSRSPTA
jgi:hypothetical protein